MGLLVQRFLEMMAQERFLNRAARAAVLALVLEEPCAKYLGGPFPMWSTQKFFGPFHAKML